MASAGLRINVPHISEAHALVSLRGAQLRLLALRGRLSVYGKPVTDVPLRAGLRVVLGGRTALEVEHVSVPEIVLALEGAGLTRPLLGGVLSLALGPPLEVRAGFAPDADLVLWVDGERVWAREPVRAADAMQWQNAPGDRCLVAGDVLTVGGHELRIAAVPLGHSALSETAGGDGAMEPVELTLHYDTVHVVVGGERIVLDGIPARLVTELAIIGQPVAWEGVAQEIWGRGEPLPRLREKWDSALARLRKKLKEGKLRRELVRSNHGGQVELVLLVGDSVRGESL